MSKYKFEEYEYILISKLHSKLQCFLFLRFFIKNLLFTKRYVKSRFDDFESTTVRFRIGHFFRVWSHSALSRAHIFTRICLKNDQYPTLKKIIKFMVLFSN